MSDPELIFHLIPHTHWDREWYLPRGQFGARLVPMLDDLIGLLQRDARIPGFLLDGQTVLLEDYLRVRPDQEDALRELVSSGRIETGPWYVLADEQIPSAEALVRNLLLGDADTAAWGRRMNVLYSPDAFGHPAILPTLGREFGIEVGVAWRGVRGPYDSDLFRWRGPDGASMLLYHLPPDGYEIGGALPSALPRLREVWPRVRAILTGRAGSRHVAVFVGADHHAGRTDLVELRASLATLESPNIVRLSRLEDFCISVRDGDNHRELSGEQRWSHGYTWTLQHVHSTRAHQKRRNSRIELWLERFAEPLATLAAHHGGRDRRPLLRHAWRTLVQCHFHDAIGGCASDQVASEVDVRMTEVEGIAGEIVRASSHELWNHDPDRAREQPDLVAPRMLLWNPAARSRSDLVFANVTCFRRDVLVGPAGNRVPREGNGYQPFSLETTSGETIPVQVLEIVPARERLDASRHYPDQDEVDLVRVAFRSPVLSGLDSRVLQPGPAAPLSSDSMASLAGRTMSNDHLDVRVENDGSLTLNHRGTGHRYRGLLGLEEEADLGDTYTFSPRAGRRPRPAIASKISLRSLATGPYVAAVEASWTIPGAETEESLEGVIRIALLVLIVACDPVVRCTLRIDNQADDHRLRLRLPLGVKGRSALAGTQFGSVLRPAVRLKKEFPAETPALTAPAHRFVAVGGDGGMSLFCPGFFEYELTPKGDLLLTVLRAVGQLSRNNLPARPGHAGWPMATPLAQCRGSHVLDFAIAPISSANPEALHRMWEDVFLPIRGTWLRDYTAGISAVPATSVELEGEGLVFSAMKPAEQGFGMVLRCYNLRETVVAGAWHFGFTVKSAGQVRADEEALKGLEVEGGRTVRFEAPARGIVTVIVE